MRGSSSDTGPPGRLSVTFPSSITGRIIRKEPLTDEALSVIPVEAEIAAVTSSR